MASAAAAEEAEGAEAEVPREAEAPVPVPVPTEPSRKSKGPFHRRFHSSIIVLLFRRPLLYIAPLYSRGPPQVRLFYLYKHLVLKCFDYLDEAGRTSAFCVMGWPMDNYMRRKENMRRQRENTRRMRLEQAKEEEERGEEDEADSIEDDGEGREKSSDCEAKDVAANGSNEGKEEAEEEAPTAGKCRTEEKEQFPSVEDVTASTALTKLAMSINEAWEDVGGVSEAQHESEGGAMSVEEKKANDGDVEMAGGVRGDDITDGKEADDGAAKTGDGGEGEANGGDPGDDGELLPPLFAQTDPTTLLARLNTRRLYARVLHFKREQRKKVNADVSQMMSSGTTKSLLSIKEMYEKQLRDKLYADRIYRKNMTVEQMADDEWEEMLEMAEIR